MKKIILIAGLLLAANGYTHDELFPACPSPHPAHPETTEETIKPPKAIYKEAPDYPTRALTNRREGSVILEYTVSTEGKVVNETVIGSTATSFAIAAKKAAKKRRPDGRLLNSKSYLQARFPYQSSASASRRCGCCSPIRCRTS